MLLGRSPISCLPNSVNRFIDHSKLIENRRNKHVELAEKEESFAPHDFEPGDKIVIQCNLTKSYLAQYLKKGFQKTALLEVFRLRKMMRVPS